jgi:alkanesulfonate monooxygenase SsuD/methylene tetrahydromethanopterin reductase-like flavin-dependent oxidoreductase (luciferase family)
MWVAGYGPKALAVAGRVGDGVIIQLADPVIIKWIMGHRSRVAAEAGRDPSELKCIVCAPSHITDDIADAREQVRWFPAMVSNHVMDLIERYGYESEIRTSSPSTSASQVLRLRRALRVGAKHGEFVTDEICDRFCVLGNAEQATAKLQGARGDRRRPVQHLPHDARPGGRSDRLRPRHHPAVRACAV